MKRKEFSAMQPLVRRTMTHASLAIAVALTAGACTSVDDTPPDNPQRVVDERVAIMKSFGAALGAASNYAQGKIAAGEAQAKLAPARAKLERVVRLFPRGTALGDKGVVNSRALTTIFNNRDDFEAKFAALERAFAGLGEGLGRNQKAQATAAFDAARGACAACHNKYRAPED